MIQVFAWNQGFSLYMPAARRLISVYPQQKCFRKGRKPIHGSLHKTSRPIEGNEKRQHPPEICASRAYSLWVCHRSRKYAGMPNTILAEDCLLYAGTTAWMLPARQYHWKPSALIFLMQMKYQQVWVIEIPFVKGKRWMMIEVILSGPDKRQCFFPILTRAWIFDQPLAITACYGPSTMNKAANMFNGFAAVIFQSKPKGRDFLPFSCSNQRVSFTPSTIP